MKRQKTEMESNATGEVLQADRRQIDQFKRHGYTALASLEETGCPVMVAGNLNAPYTFFYTPSNFCSQLTSAQMFNVRI